jgi:predicted transcriptional regulator
MSLVTSEQMRAARSMLRLEQERLAEASGVSLSTIRRLEGADGEMRAHATTLRQLQRALEAAGVVFTDGDEPGVKLRRRAG